MRYDRKNRNQGGRVINYKHLHYFVSVARSGGVSRAAERLHLTPQTLSGQITQFEERLGVALFRRVGRRLELTETGKLALSYAEEIFQTGAELEDLLKNGSDGRFITFRVGIADVVPKFIAHRLLAPVLELPAAVRLICQEDRLERLLADLAIHRLDMVLADRPLPPGTEIKGYSHPLGESGVAFMAAPALAARLSGRLPGLSGWRAPAPAGTRQRTARNAAALAGTAREAAAYRRRIRRQRSAEGFRRSRRGGLSDARGERAGRDHALPGRQAGRDGGTARAILPHFSRTAVDPSGCASGQRERAGRRFRRAACGRLKRVDLSGGRGQPPPLARPGKLPGLPRSGECEHRAGDAGADAGTSPRVLAGASG
jgi:DNA-binding transcriptional LysR family regulator